MIARDLPAISAISDAVHGRYSEAQAVYADRLALYPSGCIVHERDGRVVAYLISHPWRGDTPPELDRPLGAIPAGADRYYLHDIALLPSVRGSGAAGAAVSFVIDHARAAGFPIIDLMAVNGADGFWASRGFAYVDGACVDRAFVDGTGQSTYGPDSRHMRLTL